MRNIKASKQKSYIRMKKQLRQTLLLTILLWHMVLFKRFKYIYIYILFSPRFWLFKNVKKDQRCEFPTKLHKSKCKVNWLIAICNQVPNWAPTAIIVVPLRIYNFMLSRGQTQVFAGWLEFKAFSNLGQKAVETAAGLRNGDLKRKFQRKGHC